MKGKLFENFNYLRLTFFLALYSSVLFSIPAEQEKILDDQLKAVNFKDLPLKSEISNEQLSTNYMRDDFLELIDEQTSLINQLQNDYTEYVDSLLGTDEITGFIPVGWNFSCQTISNDLNQEIKDIILKQKNGKISQAYKDEINNDLASFEESRERLDATIDPCFKPMDTKKVNFENNMAKIISNQKTLDMHPSLYLSPSISIGIGYQENNENKTLFKSSFPNLYDSPLFFVNENQKKRDYKSSIDDIIQTIQTYRTEDIAQLKAWVKSEFDDFRKNLKIKFSDFQTRLEKNLESRNIPVLSESYNNLTEKYFLPIESTFQQQLIQDQQDLLYYKFKTYDLASLTKLLVSLTFVKVWQNYNSLNSLKQPIGQFKVFQDLIGTNNNLSKISIYDILTHQSGLQDTILEVCRVNQDKSLLQKEILERISLHYNGDPNGQRGTYVYRDTNLVVISFLLQHLYSNINGQDHTLDQILQKEMFDPLEMTQSFFVNTSKLPNNASSPVAHDPIAFECFNGISGNAGIFSTTNDLVKLGQDLINGYKSGESKFGLTRETIRAIATRSQHGRGLGVDIISKRVDPETKQVGYFSSISTGGRPESGRAVSNLSFGHSGFTGTSFWVDLEKEVVSVLLSNSYMAYQLGDDYYRLKEHDDKFEGNKNEYLSKARKLSKFIFTNFPVDG